MDLDFLKTEINKIKLIKKDLEILINKYPKIIIIGNGGSNSIASHISIDYTKFLKKQAISFSDGPRLTAYINDYGRDEAYKQFVSEFITTNNSETLVILISSSGNSMNIVNTAKYCQQNLIPYAVLSGFDKSNKLNKFSANFKYHVNCSSYGVVELAHEILLHSIVKN